jgi:hypothetical protein
MQCEKVAVRKAGIQPFSDTVSASTLSETPNIQIFREK